MDDELPATVVAQDVAGAIDGVLLGGENGGNTVGVGGLYGPVITVRDDVTFVAGHERRSGLQTKRCIEKVGAEGEEIKTPSRDRWVDPLVQPEAASGNSRK